MRTVALAVVTAALVACASSAQTATGGIEGTVTAGPMCPVEVQGSPCPPGVWTGTVRATAADGTTHETETDTAGNYHLALDPGTYSVVPLVEGGGPPTARPVTVTVSEPMQQLDLQVDSGIR
jgi:hypothetical protein